MDKTPKNKHKTKNTQLILKIYQDMKAKKRLSFFQKPSNKNKPKEKKNQFKKFKEIYKTYSLGWNNNIGIQKQNQSNDNIIQQDQSKIPINDNVLFQPCDHFSMSNLRDRNLDQESNTMIMQTQPNQRYDNSSLKNNADLTSPLHLRTISLNDQTLWQGLNRTNKKDNPNTIYRHILSVISKNSFKPKHFLKSQTKNDYSATYLQTTEGNINSSHHNKKSDINNLTLSKSISLNPHLINQLNSNSNNNVTNKVNPDHSNTIPNIKYESTKSILKRDKIMNNEFKNELFNKTNKEKQEAKLLEQRQNDILFNFSSSSLNNSSDSKVNQFGIEDNVEISNYFPIKESQLHIPTDIRGIPKYFKSDTQDTYHSSIQSDAKKNNSCSSDSLTILSRKPKENKMPKQNQHYQSQLSRISEISKYKILQDKTLKSEYTELRLIKSDDDIIKSCPSNQSFNKAKTSKKTSLNCINQAYDDNHELATSSGTICKRIKANGDRSYMSNLSHASSSKKKIADHKILFIKKQRVKALELFLNQYSINDSNKDVAIQKNCKDAKEVLIQETLKQIKSKQLKYAYKEKPIIPRHKYFHCNKQIVFYNYNKYFESELIKYFTTFNSHIHLNKNYNIDYLENTYFDVNISLKVLNQMVFYEEFVFEKKVSLFDNFKLLHEEKLIKMISKRKNWTTILTLMPVCGQLTYISTNFYNQFLLFDNIMQDDNYNVNDNNDTLALKSLSNSFTSLQLSKRIRAPSVHSQSLYSKDKNYINERNRKLSNFKSKAEKKRESNFKRLSLFKHKLKTVNFKNDFSDTLLNSHFLKRRKNRLSRKYILFYNSFYSQDNEINEIERTKQKKLTLRDYPSQLINIELFKDNSLQPNQKGDGNILDKNKSINKTIELKNTMLRALKSRIETILFHIKDHNYIRFKDSYEQFKINKETKDRDGNSMLSLAVQSNSLQIVSYLLGEGVDPNTQNVSICIINVI